MRIILKILALPVAAALSLAVAALSFLNGIAGTILNILCGLFVLCALFSLFVQGDTAWGIRGLVTAFCISPVGLPLLAKLLLDGLGGLCGSMWGYIMA